MDDGNRREVEALKAENVRLLRLLREAGLGAAAIQADHAREIGINQEEVRQVVEQARVAGERSEQDLLAANARTDGLQELYDALGRAERRQAALVDLNDRFRDSEQTTDLASIAAEVIGQTLGLARAAYGTVDISTEFVTIPADWRRDGSPSVVGRYRFSDYGSFIRDLRRGETVIVDDVAADPRTADHQDAFAAVGVRALVNVPVMERGRLVAMLILHDDQPRHWAPEKLAFVRDVAQRTHDAVERRRGEDHQRMLQNELQHRVKNTLAMVQAIASQTFRGAESASARDTFMSRVIALSQANEILTQAGWSSALVKDVVTGATVPHCAPAERFTMTGPAVEVAAKAAMALTLALHELCTNAAKYGALSNESGHVTVDWQVDDAGTFKLRWAERGGPPVSPPTRRGFGTRLIERSLGPQLGGEVKTDYDPAGVVFTMSAPLLVVQDGMEHS